MKAEAEMKLDNTIRTGNVWRFGKIIVNLPPNF